LAEAFGMVTVYTFFVFYDSELYYGGFVEDFIQLTKTLVIMENIHPNRIIKIQKLS
jgi:hypothetical protein